jgi:hypothetical protein
MASLSLKNLFSRSLLVILSALLAATMMLADTTPAAAAAATAVAPTAPVSDAAPEKAPEDRLVCHNEAQPGTLMTKKVCVRVAAQRRPADQQASKTTRPDVN